MKRMALFLKSTKIRLVIPVSLKSNSEPVNRKQLARPEQDNYARRTDPSPCDFERGDESRQGLRRKRERRLEQFRRERLGQEERDGLRGTQR